MKSGAIESEAETLKFGVIVSEPVESGPRQVIQAWLKWMGALLSPASIDSRLSET